MEASNFCLFLLMSGYVDFYLLRTSKLQLCPMVGGTPIPPITTSILSQGDLIATSQLPGVVPSLPVLFTCPRVRRTRVLLRATYVTTSFVVGVASLLGFPPQAATLLSIQGSIVVMMIGRFRLPNNFCCGSPLLVSATFLFFPPLVWGATFGSLAVSSFASFAFSESHS